MCSHPHDDHAAGLVGVIRSTDINFGTAWVHNPFNNHIDNYAFLSSLNRNAKSARRVVNILRKSLETQRAVIAAVLSRHKRLEEPFQGKDVGFLKVCGPTQSYYEALLQSFTDFEQLNFIEKSLEAYETLTRNEQQLSAYGAAFLTGTCPSFRGTTR